MATQYGNQQANAWRPNQRPFTPYSLTSDLPWSDNWRKAAAASGWNTLNQQQTDLNRMLARSGTDISGFAQSLNQPLYQQFYQNQYGAAADIGRQEQQWALEMEKMRREEEMQKEQNKYGLWNSILSSVGTIGGAAMGSWLKPRVGTPPK